MKRTMVGIKIGEVFGKWTVANIDNNNIEGKYKVLCKCSCGRTTKEVKSANLIYGTSVQCSKCKVDDISKYIEKLTKKNSPVKIKNKQCFYGMNKKAVHICPCCKKDWNIEPSKVLKGLSKCENCVNEEKTRKHIERLNAMGSVVKLKKGSIYINALTPIVYICPVCGEDWETLPNSIIRGTSMCKPCSIGKKESLLAKVLKQVLKYHFPNTGSECDLGFRGDKGGVSEYDSFIPELNLVIEFQSEFHDKETQKKHDRKKKNYAIEKLHLDYMAIDSRDFSPLEGIQLFFPFIQQIPEYVDTSKDTTRKWDINEGQKLLNEGKLYKEVAEILDTTPRAISGAIERGQLIRPSNYVRINESRRKTIYKLNTNGKK